MAEADRYRIPEVFADAHARGFGGFPLVPNSETLQGTDSGHPVAPQAYSHETILKRRAPNANKAATPSEIGALRDRAERVIATAKHTVQAVIGGMPVLLQTNSRHAANFWSRNWFLTETVVEEAHRRYGVPVVRMWCAIERRDPESAGAYYCPETRECVGTPTTTGR